MVKAVVVGDGLVSSDTLEKAVLQMNLGDAIEVTKLEWHSDLTKTEFQEYILRIETEGPENMDLAGGMLDEISTADYLFVHYSPVSKKMIEAGRKLKLIGTCRGGLEHINLQELQDKDIELIHVIRNAEPVADFTIGLIYSETRNIARAHEQIKKGNWLKTFPNDPYKTTLRNLKVGLVGIGYIGGLVIKKLQALGVEVIAYDPYMSEESLNEKDISVKLVSFETLCKESDVISLHARLTEENMNMINDKVFDWMKPSSYLINTARAGLIEKEALVKALQNGKIAGAALDVIWEEPITLDDVLLELNNITFTSHIAGDTIDAIPNSPFLLKDVINEYLKKGFSEMLVK